MALPLSALFHACHLQPLRAFNPAASSDGLIKDVKEIFKQEQSANLIPAAFLVFGLLDAVPIPTDAGYFATQRWLQINKDRLTSREFWFYQYVNYYGWDVSWYLALFMVTYFTGKTVGQKAVIGLSVISLGAIVAEIMKFSHERKAIETPMSKS